MSNYVRTAISLTVRQDHCVTFLDAAKACHLEVLGPSTVGVNGHVSLYVPPSDSKVGWGHGNHHLMKCFLFLAKVARLYQQGTRCDWTMVAYGDDGNNYPFGTVVLSHADIYRDAGQTRNLHVVAKRGVKMVSRLQAHALGIIDKWCFLTNIDNPPLHTLYLVRTEGSCQFVVERRHQAALARCPFATEEEIIPLGMAPGVFDPGLVFSSDGYISDANHDRVDITKGVY